MPKSHLLCWFYFKSWTVIQNSYLPVVSTIYHELTIVVTKRLGEILTLVISALISIFGNVHRPCKYYSNIVKNSLHHVYSFFFSFLFWLYLCKLPVLEMCTDRPCKQYPNNITNSEHHPYFFLWFYCLKITLFCNWSEILACGSTGMAMISAEMPGIQQGYIGHP